MLVHDIMSKHVITVNPDDSILVLMEKFIEYNFHTLPVIDDERNVLAVVDYEDIMKIFVPHNPALEKLLKSIHMYNIPEEDILEAELPRDLAERVAVEDIMDTHVVTADEDSTIAHARSLMKQHSTQRLPVVKDGKLTGFITLFDIIIALFKTRDIIK